MTPRHLSLLLLMLCAALFAAGCGSSDSDSDDSGGGAASNDAAESADLPEGTIGVELGEFFVKPSSKSIAAGEVTFQAMNMGSAVHELVIYRTDEEPSALKQDSGVAVLDPANVIDQIDDLPAGDEAELSVTLEAGKYLLLCNLPGHYQAGQVVAFTVT